MNINFDKHFGAPQMNVNSLSQDKLAPKAASAAYQNQDKLIISSDAQRETESGTGVKEPGSAGTGKSAFTIDEDLRQKLVRLSERTKAAEEYYAKQNEENKTFANPEQHIWKKYHDRNYKHYVKGLTEDERETACRNELDVLKGLNPHINAYDPAMLKANGEFGYGFAMDDNLNARAIMNDSINQLFKENGITIPEDADLQLTVDPYDFMIHVSGVDRELAKKIEDVLNQGENGRHLYDHISASNPAHYGYPEPLQYTEGDAWKMSVFHIIKESTGYDLKDLERKDGKFLTPDGQDVWELIKPEYKDSGSINEGVYKALAKSGWDSREDANLTIGYKNGSLYDIGTEYGYGEGQTEWVDRAREDYKEDQKTYMAKREETIRWEESRPNKYEQLFINMGAQRGASLDGAFNGPGLILEDGTFSPQTPISQELIERLNLAFKEGKGALTKAPLRLPKTVSRIQQGYDYKV